MEFAITTTGKFDFSFNFIYCLLRNIKESIILFPGMVAFKAGYGVNGRKSIATIPVDYLLKFVPDRTLAIQDQGQSFTVLTTW